MKKMILLCCLFPIFPILAQTGSVAVHVLSGSLINESGQAIGDELIFLLHASDTTVVKTEFTDKEGKFAFQQIPAGDYLISVRPMGYQPVMKAVKLQQDLALEPVRMALISKDLQEISVVQRKPFIERGPGKFALNVEASIQGAGSSAFELIARAPGVQVSATDEIRLNGRGGLQFQINGKMLPMSGTDLANYLRGISSEAIEKIEFITNPGAKQDASGSAIINIKLKKDMRLGTNGIFTASYGQGVYPKTGQGLSLNHRSKKWNVYGSYNFVYRKGFNHLELDRNFYVQDSFTGAFVQDNYLIFPFKNHLMRLGADFTPDQKNSFSLVLNGVSNRFKPTGTNISLVESNQHQAESWFETTNNSEDNWFNGSMNFNYTRSLDTLGSTFSADLDYARYGNKTEQNFETTFYDLAHQPLLKPYLLYGDLQGSLGIHSLKADYTKAFKNGHKLEAGAKTSYVIADNNLKFYDRSNETSVFDSTKSNHFIYQELISAAYVNWDHSWKKWHFNYGVRSEMTRINGEQRVYSQVNDTLYVQLFPSASVSYQFNENHQLNLNVNRRIDRPNYDQLNPFKFYLDPSTYKEGNPYLGPQTTYGFDIGYQFKQKYFLMVGMAQTVNNLTEILAPLVPNSNVIVQTFRNLASTQMIYTNLSLPFEYKKWSSSTDINAYYANYTGNIANTQLNKVETYAFNINTVHNFQLGKKTSLELSANYRTREVYAFDSINRIWFIGFGVQQKILKNNGTLKLSVTDLCFSNKISANVNYNGYHEYFLVSRETRVATLAFSYRFGNKQVAAARRRAGGADDLKRRVNSQGNG